MNEQIFFDFKTNITLDMDSFFVNRTNEKAFSLITNNNCLENIILVGPRKSGKSHLANIWKLKANALSITSPLLDLINLRKLLEHHENVLIDNFDSSWNEEPILHLYNLMQEVGGTLVIISEKPASQIDIKLRDLASRVSTMTTVELKPPDDELIKGVMRKLFKDRQIEVPSEVVNYLTIRMERSFKEVSRMVDRLDKTSLSEKNAITLSLARRILQEKY